MQDARVMEHYDIDEYQCKELKSGMLREKSKRKREKEENEKGEA